MEVLLLSILYRCYSSSSHTSCAIIPHYCCIMVLSTKNERRTQTHPTTTTTTSHHQHHTPPTATHRQTRVRFRIHDAAVCFLVLLCCRTGTGTGTGTTTGTDTGSAEILLEAVVLPRQPTGRQELGSLPLRPSVCD